MIRTYVGLVDPATPGRQVTAFVRVRLDGQDDRYPAAFKAAIDDFREVMDCDHMTGESDYQLPALVSSLGAFEDFLRRKLA